MQRIAELCSRQLALVHVVAVTLVDDNAVGHFHDASLDALQFVARSCQLYEQEEIHHGMAGRLALANSYRLHENLVVAGCFAEDDGLARLACHTSQATRRGTGTDEGVRVYGEFFHAGLVAQYASLGALAGGVNGQYGQFASVFLQYMNAEFINAGALAGSGYATDADAHGVSTVGQASFYDFLCHLLVGRMCALHQGDGLPQDGGVPLEDSFHVVIGRQLSACKTLALEVWVDVGRLLHSVVDNESCIFRRVLWMLHGQSVVYVNIDGLLGL